MEGLGFVLQQYKGAINWFHQLDQLDRLSIFCAIFKMEVNHHELTTLLWFVVSFSGPKLKESTWSGFEICRHCCAIQGLLQMLGSCVACNKRMFAAADGVAAASGNRAMHAILGRC
jgi:hypothetical protein